MACIDVDLRTMWSVPENEISSGSNTSSHGVPAVDDVDIASPRYPLPGSTSANSSSKKRKSPDDFATSTKKCSECGIEEISKPIYSNRHVFCVWRDDKRRIKMPFPLAANIFEKADV